MEKGLSSRIKKGVARMEPLIELLDLISDTVEANCNLDSKISLEELSPKGGLYAEVGEGFTDTAYFDKSTIKTVPVLFLCRSANQKRGLEQLCSISNYLQRLKKYPQGKSFSWLDTTIAKEPNKIGRDEDGMYNFSCILNCTIYY